MENTALCSKSLMLPITGSASEMLLRLRSTGCLPRSLWLGLGYLMQLGFRGRGVPPSTEVVSNAQSQGIISWPLLHVITLFSVLSTNHTINTNVLGELSSAEQ